MNPQPPNQPPQKTGHIHLNVPMSRKTAYVKASYPNSLSKWMTTELDKAARVKGFEPEPEPKQEEKQ